MSSVSVSEGGCEASEVVNFVQRCSTWERGRGARFSRLAERVSRQYAQWAWVAMLGAGC